MIGLWRLREETPRQIEGYSETEERKKPGKAGGNSRRLLDPSHLFRLLMCAP